MIAEDGKSAICQRIESNKRVKDAGWLHKLDGEVKPKCYLPKAKPQPVVNFYKLAHQYQGMMIDPSGDLTEFLAKMLGVTVHSLWRLCAGFDGKNFTFPMWDGRDRIIGIRLRTPEAKKFSVVGSKNGLFWPAGVEADSKNLLFICEGPTDCAALLDMGFDAIGRPSCSGGTEFIKTLLTGHDRTVVVMSDKDAVKTTPQGRQFKPGQEGAARLGKIIKPLCRSVRIIKPCQGKDVREWYNKGATAAAVMAVVKNTRFL